MHDETPESRRSPGKSGPAPTPTEAELSRIAREAVHQAPDRRFDEQLVRMGLLDAPESAERRPAGPTSHPVAIDPDLEHLRDQLRRARMHEWLLVGVIVVLAIMVIVLLIAR
jgi:hypothetical protein